MGVVAHLSLFVLFQVVANLAFKWGSLEAWRFWWGFFLGNLVGASSIWFTMQVYRELSPNMAFTLCSGLTFVAVQVALRVVFGAPLHPLQWLGLALAVGGMTLFGLTAPAPVETL